MEKHEVAFPYVQDSMDSKTMVSNSTFCSKFHSFNFNTLIY